MVIYLGKSHNLLNTTPTWCKFQFILYRLERHDMFDMIPILFDSTLMIARPTPLDMDFGLLIRPYRREAWVMVGVTVAVIFAFLILPGFLVPNFSTYTR